MEPGKIKYSESEFKTLLACSKLYSLGGSINNYDASQKFIRYALHKFILKVLKGELADIDNQINKCVNLAFNRFYIKNNLLEEEILKLKSFAFSFIHFFIKNFSLKNYRIVSGPTNGTMIYDEAEINFGLDAIFNSKIHKAQLHAIIFIPYTDTHILRNDIGLRIKADYLRKYANSTFRRSKNSPVTLHIFSSYKFNFYKSKTKTYKFHYTKIPYEEVPSFDIDNYIKKANFVIDYPVTIPICQNLKCSKRKECLNG